MPIVDTLPVWALAITIFSLRLLDVSLGTLRTVSVVQGRLPLSVAIGFVEILIWVVAVSQVIVRLHDSPALVLAYAGGFAIGNACGIMLERQLALGRCVVRMIASREGEAIATRLRAMGHVLTTFSGEGHDGPRVLMFTTCTRRQLRPVIEAAASLDPYLFYTVDRFSQSEQFSPLPHPTGWRAILKKK